MEISDGAGQGVRLERPILWGQRIQSRQGHHPKRAVGSRSLIACTGYSDPCTGQHTAWLANLKIPKLRAGSYFPPFLEARKTTEKALVAVIQEAWIGGVSTRRVDEIAQAMGLSGISKSQVSKLCKEIDEQTFLERPLGMIAVAANTEGRREIVGLGIGPSEAERELTRTKG